VFEHPRLRLLRVAGRAQAISLPTGARGEVSVFVPSYGTLRGRLCGRNETGTESQGMMAGYVRDASGKPLARAHVWASWQIGWVQQNGRLVSTNQQRTVETDTNSDGSYLMCGLSRATQITATTPAHAAGTVDVVVTVGVQSSARMEEYIRERFPVARFEELRVPFAAVATDLHTGAAVVMRDAGDLALAIRASCAVPGWYVPVTDGQGRQLVDGGLVANLPVSVVRALGAEVVVAVDVNYEGAKFMGPPASVVGVLLQSLIVAQRTAVEHQRQLADVCISPAVGHLRWDELERAEEFIEAGALAARAAVPAIKELLEPQPAEDPGWFSFRRSRDRQAAKD